ncbi:transposase [[Flexibacter] sp. ATCC 35208]|uniref:transposase n=1 Tax=Chitinophaga sp. LS1 TaxID=3051176 RepID=UPI00117F0967
MSTISVPKAIIPAPIDTHTINLLLKIPADFDPFSNFLSCFLSADTELNAASILRYYRLRFQIEFLIRDAKQHAGLDQFQARSGNKLSFHFNMAFTTVSIVKATFWLRLPINKRGAFSMRNIKLAYYNKFLADRIFTT